MSEKRLRFRSHAKLVAWSTLVFTVVVILWGAVVRATGSGAGCGNHWPLCNGEVVPRSPAMETLIELTHRVTSGLAMLLAAVLAFVTRKGFPKGHPARLAGGLSLGFMLLEAAIGAGLVLLELVGQNSSAWRAWVVSGHLVNTFLLVGAMTFAVWAVKLPETAQLRWSSDKGLRALTLVTMVVFCLVGASGAVVALGDTLFPAASLAEGLAQDFREDAHFLLRLRVVHPAIAILATGLLALTGVVFRKRVAEPAVQDLSLAVTLMAVTQVALGFANMALLAPVTLQIAHLLLADATWITLVYLALAGLTLAHSTSSSPESSRITADFLRPSVRLKN